MAASAAHAVPPEHARQSQACWAWVVYAVRGDQRFLSHHDETEVLVRAMTRAAWPLSFSAGFNPQARVKLPLPRSVGTAAESQLALATLTEAAVEAEALAARLGPVLPRGFALHEVRVAERRVQPHPVRSDYAAALDGVAIAAVRERLDAFLAAGAWEIDRDYGPHKPRKRIDIRPYVVALLLRDDRLIFTLDHSDQRTARPGEVLAALGLPAADYSHRVTRVGIHWDVALPEQQAATRQEGTDSGEEENDHDAQA